MHDPSVPRTDAVEHVLETYGDLLFRICLAMLRNPSEAEDVVQDTLLKLLQKAPVFENPEHEKAWLIRVASNECRDRIRFWHNHPEMTLDELQLYGSAPENSGILEALMQIPEKFRIVMILYYVEEYRTEEIANIIHKSASAVKMRLQKGRKLLEAIYRKEYL